MSEWANKGKLDAQVELRKLIGKGMTRAEQGKMRQMSKLSLFCANSCEKKKNLFQAFKRDFT